MQSVKAPDFLDAGAVSRSRSPSVVSTDSQFSRVNLMSPPSVTPAPGFVSSSAATDIISADQEFNAADFVAEDECGSGAALVTPAALSLLNAFLDNLLFNILASSKSTQLACIRPAMAEVLKPRLAKEVVAAAEEELSEYMGGAEDEQTEFRGGQEPGGDFDLVRSWKLTRLRCMVYTRLGDMEEDDEDEFIAQDGLGETDGAPRRFTSHVDNITPAASIFLTSIIEFIGERALVIAGETARSRLLSKLNDGDELNEAGDERKRIDRLVVEDLDMEKLALNPTLGRLWRTWRKRRRGTTLTRTMSRESFSRRGFSGVSRKSSIATIEEPMTPNEPLPQSPPLDPATVPLPMSDYDVQEIEVPGYTGDLEGEVQTMQAVVAHKVRPRSLMVFSSPSLAPRSPGGDNSPVSASAIDPPKLVRHVRSRSLPTEATNTPAEAEAEATLDQPSPTPSEKKKLETMYEDDESAEFVDAVETAPGVAITTPHKTSQLPENAVEDSDKARMSVLHEEEEAPLAVNEMVASLRAGNDEDLTDQSNSARVSVASLGDRSNQKDPEVIESTGLCEKPKWTSSINRPKRKSSRDVSLLNARSISAQTSGPEMQAVAENQPPTQGVETTQPATPNTPVEAIDSSTDQDATDGDQNKPAMISTPPTRNSDGVEVEKFQAFLSSPNTSRPTSADSERSQTSKTRPRPAPLLVQTSNRSSTASERAAVQRMSTRPSTSVASTVHTKTRRSSSFGSAREIKRPVTAGSTTSQVSTKLKGLMGRPQGDSPSLRLRSSSETSRASGGSGDSDNEIADLDKLINSDETIHFTLTPRSVREMTFPDPPNRPIPRSETTDTSDLADFLKTTSPPGEEKHRSRASVSSKATGEMIPVSRTKSTESSKHIPLSTRLTNRPAKPSKTTQAAQARDARGPTDATRDFADFIKAPGAPSSPSTSALAQPKTSTSGERPQPVRPPSSLSTASRGNRPRLEARSADTSSSQTSELIDFIREGPPMPGAHRIPRTVAPFRNTIDSDDLQMDNTPEHTTVGSIASTGNASNPNKSMTSLGSRTALLDSNRNNAPASGSATAFEDPAPQRKQRRVRDPYAIDDDDDDEYLEELLELENKPKPKREEESLMDFLRSAPPPPESDKPPVPFTVNTAAANARMRSGMVRSSQSSLRSQGSVPGKVVNNYATKVGMERNNGSIPSASNRKTETGDLADFLRNTGPPEPAARAVSSPTTSKMSSGGLSRFFTRRKKVES
ncbi:hypothetical protein PENANT_c001G04365 [Penicillium antarcticum]|uniref:Uncharacterized protein n=1 Tax=Penicillium antarcticum TaxID=416450 RepID=A0A1V6QNG9_9EURO|nr:hypothetical protein PENANT_c001G04365 [Penicillium antarcticum]